MPTLNSRTFAARLREREAEELLSQLTDISFSQWVRDRLDGSYGGIPKEIVRDLEIMTYLDGGRTFEDLFKELHRALDEGEIRYTNGKLRAGR